MRTPSTDRPEPARRTNRDSAVWVVALQATRLLSVEGTVVEEAAAGGAVTISTAQNVEFRTGSDVLVIPVGHHPCQRVGRLIESSPRLLRVAYTSSHTVG